MSHPARYAVCIDTQFGRDVQGWFDTMDDAEAALALLKRRRKGKNPRIEDTWEGTKS